MPFILTSLLYQDAFGNDRVLHGPVRHQGNEVSRAEAGRIFSLMLLSSRAAAVTGPLIWGITVDVLEPSLGTAIAYRAAVLTVVAMFAASLLLLRRVPDPVRVRR